MKASEASFGMLKKFRKGYWASFNKSHSLEDFELRLNQFISAGAYFYEGQVVDARQLVDKIGAIKIEIYPNEHVLPHFHINSNGPNASFAIDYCRKLKDSGFDSKVIRSIQDWFEHSKDRLIEVWNATRPDNCVVGKIS